MKYKRLGRTGLLVSELSFGTWITFNKSGQISKAEQAYEVMKTAFKAGVNFFDCAELYANGEAEEITGEAYQMGVKENLWKRTDLVISTKLFFGAIPEEGKPGYNEHMIKVNRVGCSRKHIIEGMKESLERMSLDYVDLVFSHRPDPLVDIEEVVRGFNYLIEQGYCFYWGTSEWSAQMIQEAITVAERLNLIGPVMEQPEYNLARREQVEIEYRRLYPKIGLTIWSPLYNGILTGKYNEGIPEGSRLATEMFKDTKQSDKFKNAIEGTKKLEPIAKEIGCTLAQLALAWCMSNPNVSTTIGGASSIKQVEENLKAVEFVDKLTPEILKQIDDIFQPPGLSSGDKMGITIRKKAGEYRHIDI